MMNFVYVALGGAIGSVMRYGLGLLFSSMNVNFPWATLVCNVVGSLVLGVVVAFGVRCLPEGWRLLLSVGLCGGFTTFSTFSLEGLKMIQAGDLGMFVVYVLVTLCAGVGALWVGVSLGNI